VPVVGAVYAVAIAVGLAFEDGVSVPVGLCLLVALIAYCVARPAKGTDIFLISAMPSAVSAIVETVADVSRWWIAVPLIPVALLLIAHEDRVEAS
jgi:hypothetical protein